MAGNRKPRKAHKPKPHGIPMTIRHDAEAEMELQINPHLELLKLREGYGEEASWHTLTCRLNIGCTLAHQNKLRDAYLEIQVALQAMREIWARFERTAKFGVSGDELKAIGGSLVLTDDLQKTMTRRQLATAMRYVNETAAY